MTSGVRSQQSTLIRSKTNSSERRSEVATIDAESKKEKGLGLIRAENVRLNDRL